MAIFNGLKLVLLSKVIEKMESLPSIKNVIGKKFSSGFENIPKLVPNRKREHMQATIKSNLC